MSLDLSYAPGGESEVVATRSRRHRILETWRFTGSAGGPVLVDAHLPDSGVDRIVIVGHGADDSRKARYVEVSGKSFGREGTAVIAMDAPRHGDRPGPVGLDRLPGLLVEVLEEWVRDHRLLLDVVEMRWPGVPIGFAGFSMGGLFGVPLMAVDDRIASGVVVIAGSTRLSYADRIPLGDDELAILDLTDPIVHAPEVGAPVLVVCAADDEIVPVGAGAALASAFRVPAGFVVLPGTHTEWRRAAEWFRTIERFLRRELG